jgi:hypothetical protein
MMEKLNDKVDDSDQLHDTEVDDEVERSRTFETVFKLTNSKTSITSLGEILFETANLLELQFKYDIIICQR